MALLLQNARDDLLSVAIHSNRCIQLNEDILIQICRNLLFTSLCGSIISLCHTKCTADNSLQAKSGALVVRICGCTVTLPMSHNAPCTISCPVVQINHTVRIYKAKCCTLLSPDTYLGGFSVKHTAKLLSNGNHNTHLRALTVVRKQAYLDCFLLLENEALHNPLLKRAL